MDRLYNFTLFSKQNAGAGDLQYAQLDWEGIVTFLTSFETTDDKFIKRTMDRTRYDNVSRADDEREFGKQWVEHFNGWRYSTIDDVEDKNYGLTARRDSLAIDCDFMVLDIDDGFTVEQFKEEFSEYRYVLYTSYYHQREKNGETARDKFRAVIPFTRTITKQDWMDYIFDKDFKDHDWTLPIFAPFNDPNSVKTTQPFCLPIKHVDGQSEFHVNEGKDLDIFEWNKVDRSIQSTVRNASTSSASAGGSFPIDQTFRLTNGAVVTVADLPLGDTTNMYCPFHSDGMGSNTSSNIRKHSEHSASHTCFACGSGEAVTRIMERDRFDDSSPLTFKNKKGEEKSLKVKTQKKTVVEVKAEHGPLLEYDVVDEPVVPFNREERAALLKKKCLNDLPKRTLLYAFEGFGKSHLATMLVIQKQETILFCCNSNEQVAEQATSFAKFRFNEVARNEINSDGQVFKVEHESRLLVQRIVSVAFRLEKEYKFEVVRGKPQHPWDSEAVDKTASIKKMVAQRPDMAECEAEAEELWNELSPEQPDYKNHDIIVTTQSRVNSWGRRQMDEDNYRRFIDDDVIIVFDDPEQHSFKRLVNVDGWDMNTLIDGELLEVEEHGNKRYFVRPSQFTVGYGLAYNRMIFTTTELITSHLIESTFETVYKPALMPEEKMRAGNITMMKTNMVAASRDGFIPVMVERVKKETGRDIEYFADGQGNIFNLTNSKGQNQFKAMDTVVEISQPTPIEAIDVCNELGWEHNCLEFVKTIMAVDKMNQAIGRNSGYRFSDGEQATQCVVLCDPSMFDTVLKSTRYYVGTVVDCGEFAPDYRKRNGEGIVEWFRWLIQNHDEYMVKGVHSKRPYQDWMCDAKVAIATAGNHTQRLTRLEKALMSKIEAMDANKTVSDRKTQQIVVLLDEIALFGNFRHSI